MKNLFSISVIFVIFGCNKSDTSIPSSSATNTSTHNVELIGTWKQDSSRNNGITKYDSTPNSTVRIYDTIYITSSSYREAQWTIINPPSKVYTEGDTLTWQTTALDSLILNYVNIKYPSANFKETYKYSINSTSTSKELLLIDTSGVYWFHPIK